MPRRPSTYTTRKALEMHGYQVDTMSRNGIYKAKERLKRKYGWKAVKMGKRGDHFLVEQVDRSITVLPK